MLDKENGGDGVIDFNSRMTNAKLERFADYVIGLQRQIGFRISARGWCYQLETERIINKDQFDKVEGWINKCRRTGLLPIDFIAEDSARRFSVVEKPDEESPIRYTMNILNAALNAGDYYTPDWWRGEDYYIQIIVEKIDLKTLFMPVCEKYHIPIATSKGWSSMSQRAEYARRFKKSEDDGRTAVLLYCGDHDPDGLRISDFLRSNLEDLKNIAWSDGEEGYDPQLLEINRFGLNQDFIETHQLTWIDNLITGSGKNLASPSHRNFRQPYVQEYLSEVGERKCEANAIIPIPNVARQYVEDVILSYLGQDAEQRFRRKREAVLDVIEKFKEDSGLEQFIQDLFDNNSGE